MSDASGDGRPFDPTPWRAEILSFVRKMGVFSDAEDVVQEAFVRAIARPPSTSPRAWLYRVALRLVTDRRRERGRDARLLSGGYATAAARRAGRADTSGASESSDDPAAVAERRDLARAAWRAARALPPKQRAALILRVRRGMDYDELAEVLGGSVATARQHFYLAARAVRRALHAGDDDPPAASRKKTSTRETEA